MCHHIGVKPLVQTQLNFPSIFLPSLLWRQTQVWPGTMMYTYLKVLLALFWERSTFAEAVVIYSSSPANDGSSLIVTASFFALPASAHVKTSFAFILYCWRVFVERWRETPFGKSRHVELDYLGRAQLKHHYHGNNDSKHHLCRIEH